MRDTTFSKSQIEQAVKLAGFDVAAAQKLMMPRPRGIRPSTMVGNPRQGGVLVLTYAKENRTHLVLTRRRDDLDAHAGQVSFPGGRREDGESLEATALREAQEEIGISQADVTVLGALECLWIPPTDYEVHPFVGWYEPGPPSFVAQDREVAEILEVPLDHLLDPANRREEPWVIRGFDVLVPFFLVDGHKVWGATAIMLSEFLERLRIIANRTL